MKNSHIKIFLFVVLSLSIGWISCKKFIEVAPPVTRVNEGNVYENDGTAISTVIGIYTAMSSSDISGILSFYPELSGDNLRMLNLTLAQQAEYYQNNLLASDGGSTLKPWLIIYPRIFNCNAVIEGLNKTNSVTKTVRQNLLGQAYFLRAFFYFYLTNFYGDVPLALTTDYKVNNSLRKNPIAEVYSQVIADLKQAQTLLPEGYLAGDMKTTFSPGEEQRTTPNRAAASALLARVYLYRKDWENAEAMATEVISNSTLYSASITLDQVFLKNSKETIWALQPVITGVNTEEAEFFTLQMGEPTVSTNRSSFLSQEFMDNFQPGDQRKIAWVGTITTAGISYQYPAKYRALFGTDFTEQSILLRLAEQYLIRAEARIQRNNVVDGISDLNAIRDRAIDKSEPDENKRLKPWPSSLSKDDAIKALNYERRVELFAECAHRWFDLKRSGQLDAIMAPATASKGGTWSSFKALYPIPAEELTSNANLIQNEGYKN